MKGEINLESVQYRLCPLCARAVPINSVEHFCINDGTLLLESCPKCQTPIFSPYARNCAGCGYGFEHPLSPDEPISKARVDVPKPARVISFFAYPAIAVVVFGIGLALFLTQAAKPTLQTVFVGKIPKTQALIAIAINQEQVLGYICDGKSIAQWFQGKIQTSNTLEMRSKTGALLNARFDSQNIQGTVQLVQLQTKPFSFAALPTRDRAALYRAERGGTNKAVAGWIVLPNGEQRAALLERTGLRALPAVGVKNSAAKILALGLVVTRVNPQNPQSFGF